MPIYEYACTNCGERTEAKQGFDDPPLEECAVCGGKLRKLYSPVGIVFKGSGFYATDSKKSKDRTSKDRTSKDRASKDRTAKETEPATGSSGSSDNKTESKSGKKTESKKTESKTASSTDKSS